MTGDFLTRRAVLASGLASVAGCAAAPSAAGTHDGYSKLYFEDDFASLDSIDLAQTGDPGYLWYTDPPFGYASPMAKLTILDSTILRIENLEANANWALCTASPRTLVGHTFKHGYYEARLRFDPQGDGDGCPAFWSEETAALQNDPNKMTSVEIDFFEALKRPAGLSSRVDFMGTAIVWTRPTVGAPGVKTANDWNNKVALGIDDQWHNYGLHWEPGRLTWFFDEEQILSLRTSGAFEPVEGCAGISPILGTAPGWPLDIDWVRVWGE